MSDTVERYFSAMQLGADGEDELVSLFADDAVWVDAFGGGVHAGRAEIQAWLRSSRSAAPPDLRLLVERIDAEGDVVVADWVCESPAFTSPARGRDRFTIRAGKIARLESTLTQPPELA